MAFGILVLSKMTFGIMALSIMTFGIMTPSIMTFSINNTQHKHLASLCLSHYAVCRRILILLCRVQLCGASLCWLSWRREGHIVCIFFITQFEGQTHYESKRPVKYYMKSFHCFIVLCSSTLRCVLKPKKMKNLSVNEGIRSSLSVFFSFNFEMCMR